MEEYTMKERNEIQEPHKTSYLAANKSSAAAPINVEIKIGLR